MRLKQYEDTCLDRTTTEQLNKHFCCRLASKINASTGMVCSKIAFLGLKLAIFRIGAPVECLKGRY